MKHVTAALARNELLASRMRIAPTMLRVLPLLLALLVMAALLVLRVLTVCLLLPALNLLRVLRCAGGADRATGKRDQAWSDLYGCSHRVPDDEYGIPICLLLVAFDRR